MPCGTFLFSRSSDHHNSKIATNLSTVRGADRILVIEEGRITEAGTHTELLKAGGHYYRLYTQQFREELRREQDPFMAASAETD